MLKRSQKEQLTQKPPETEMEMMEFMLKTMIQHCKSQDKIYFEMDGVCADDDEFQRSLMWYYTRDPEVTKEFTEF